MLGGGGCCHVHIEQSIIFTSTHITPKKKRIVYSYTHTSLKVSNISLSFLVAVCWPSDDIHWVVLVKFTGAERQRQTLRKDQLTEYIITRNESIYIHSIFE